MSNMEILATIVSQAIDEVNTQLLPEQRLENSPDSILIGKESNFDSMALVNLIIAIEEKIASAFDVDLSLIDEMANSKDNHVFDTVGAFTGFIDKLINEKKHG